MAADVLAARGDLKGALSLVELLTPYIRDHKGNLVDFRALVRDANGNFELPESTQPFAELVVGFAKTLGLMPVWSVPVPNQITGSIALIVHEKTPGEAERIAAALRGAGHQVHQVVLPSLDFRAQVHAAEAIIFVEPEVVNPSV